MAATRTPSGGPSASTRSRASSDACPAGSSKRSAPGGQAVDEHDELGRRRTAAPGRPGRSSTTDCSRRTSRARRSSSPARTTAAQCGNAASGESSPAPRSTTYRWRSSGGAVAASGERHGRQRRGGAGAGRADAEQVTRRCDPTPTGAAPARRDRRRVPTAPRGGRRGPASTGSGSSHGRRGRHPAEPARRVAYDDREPFEVARAAGRRRRRGPVGGDDLDRGRRRVAGRTARPRRLTVMTSLAARGARGRGPVDAEATMRRRRCR